MSTFQQPFLTRDHPKFDTGAKWDENTLEILEVRKTGDGMWDYVVKYKQIDGTTAEKDIWSFQIRHVP